MNHADAYNSWEAMGEQTTAVALAHIDHVFRRILRGPMVVVEHLSVRWITSGSHPSGYFAIVFNAADQEYVKEAVILHHYLDAPAVLLLMDTATVSGMGC